ncbi:MAG: hypothetical protein KDJ90_04035 [Nitratireductor sp.]|nr:hypothetical protein [Nitratireductor sp.]
MLAANRNMLHLRGVTRDDTIQNLFPLTRHPHGAFARAMNAAWPASSDTAQIATRPGR